MADRSFTEDLPGVAPFRSGIDRVLADPVVRLMLDRGALTRVQLESLLIDFFLDELYYSDDRTEDLEPLHARPTLGFKASFRRSVRSAMLGMPISLLAAASG